MTDRDTKLMYRLTRDVERARHRAYRVEADSLAHRIIMRVVGVVGALGLLAIATAAIVTIDAHTGHQLAQWFPPQGCK